MNENCIKKIHRFTDKFESWTTCFMVQYCLDCGYLKRHIEERKSVKSELPPDIKNQEKIKLYNERLKNFYHLR